MFPRLKITKNAFAVMALPYIIMGGELTVLPRSLAGFGGPLHGSEE